MSIEEPALIPVNCEPSPIYVPNDAVEAALEDTLPDAVM